MLAIVSHMVRHGPGGMKLYATTRIEADMCLFFFVVVVVALWVLLQIHTFLLNDSLTMASMELTKEGKQNKFIWNR